MTESMPLKTLKAAFQEVVGKGKFYDLPAFSVQHKMELPDDEL
jgi:hypothetical protein